MEKWDIMRNPSIHIDKRTIVKLSQQLLQNGLRLKTSIETTKWLSRHVCENIEVIKFLTSTNENIEVIKLLASTNENIEKVILDCALRNTKYTSLMIQKEIEHYCQQCKKENSR